MGHVARVVGVVGTMFLAAPLAFSMQTCPPDSPERLQSAIAVLDAPLPADQPLAFQQRIALLNDPILRCDGPNPAAALFRLFLRSRYGIRSAGAHPGLPEDPDLFERALVALQSLPPERVVAGAGTGLSDGLVDLALERLRQDWLLPAVAGLDASDRSLVETWQPPPDLPTRADALVELLAEDTPATLFSLTTGGGSLAEEVVHPIQDALLARMLEDFRERASLVRALCGVVTDGQLVGPAVQEVLRTFSSGDPPTMAAIQRAREATASARPWPRLQRPSVPPGRVPGLEARTVPTTSLADAVARPASLPSLEGGWMRLLAGLFLTIGAAGVGVGARSTARWTGPLFGLGLLLTIDGLTDACDIAPPASDHPLFQFIAQSGVELHPLDHQTVWVGGGSMRHATIRSVPAPDTRRVVFLGASTVHGSHYIREQTLPAQVAARIPGLEALNFGIGGTTSAGVAAAGRTALSLQPDALVVLYGHNEAAQFTRLALYNHTTGGRLSARLWLNHSGLYRLLTGVLRSDTSASAPPDLYRTGPPDRAEVQQLTTLAVQHLRQQLGGLFEAARSAGVPVLLVLPPTNYRFAHLQAFETPGPGDAADLQHLRDLAEASAQDGHPVEARQYFQEAIDRSASPREVVTPIRHELVHLGKQYGLPTLDAGAWMMAHAPDGVTPSGLFWDDVHPTAEGHAVLTELIAPVLSEVLDSPTTKSP